jgi:hypothetical protein
MGMINGGGRIAMRYMETGTFLGAFLFLKIRDDQRWWEQVEVYIRDHSEAVTAVRPFP